MCNDSTIPKLFVILGPTAVGKSSIALKLAKEFKASIINADSLQIYKHFDIGTSKPSQEERDAVPHFMVDILDPDEVFNAGYYRKEVIPIIEKLNNDNKRIIVVGGTFLYVKVLLSGIINQNQSDFNLRNKIDRIRKAKGNIYLYHLLERVDKEASRNINKNDYIRIMRALEVFFSTGSKISDLQNKHNFNNRNYEIFKVGLRLEREKLNKTIDKRVDQMFDNGLVDEVKGIISMGYSPDIKPMQSIGYKEVNNYLAGIWDLSKAISMTKQNTRRYAKRQMTWLRKEDSITWYNNNEDEKIFESFVRFFNV